MAEASPSDAELVRRAQAGRTQAFGRLVERHQHYIYSAVRHLVGNVDLAEDIAQDVFLKAYAALDGFRGDARFTTWLYGIMLNCVRSHWRRAGRAKFLSVDNTGEEEADRYELESERAGPLEHAVREEHVRRVRKAIAELEPSFREIIVLRDIQGLTYEELAEALELPAGTVKSRLYRARQQLKDSLEPYWASQ